MTPHEIIDKFRAAHEMLDGLKADILLEDPGADDPRWNRVLIMIAEGIDALVKAGEEGR